MSESLEVIPARAEPPRRPLLVGFTIVASSTIAGVGLLWVSGVRFNLANVSFHPHAPDLALLAVQPFTIQLHVAAAMTALGLGLIQLAGVKGTTAHRILGWSWVAAMGTTAVSSLFIREINHGSFSFIHLLSGWVIVALPMALFFIRRGNVRQHARFMTGLFVGGLLIAGVLAFLPGRLMWRLFFG